MTNEDESLTDVQKELKSMGFTKKQYDRCAMFMDFSVALEFILSQNPDDGEEEQVKADNPQSNNDNDNNNNNNNNNDNNNNVPHPDPSPDVKNEEPKPSPEKEKEEPEKQAVNQEIKSEVNPPLPTPSSDPNPIVPTPAPTKNETPSPPADISHNFRDRSKPVGINRMDAQYLNPLLQSLFFIPRFRYAVLYYPYTDLLSHFDFLHVLKELQKLFSLMYATDKFQVDPKKFLNELIHIGNTLTYQAQLDPIEFCEAFYRKLKMSVNTSLKNMNQGFNIPNRKAEEKNMEELFASLHLDYRRNVVEDLFEFELSSSVEDFLGDIKVSTSIGYQVELPNSAPDLLTALWDFTSPRDVKQHSRGHLIDAKSTSFFLKPAPILHIQIKRFAFTASLRSDFNFVHGPFSFPLNFYLDPYLHENRTTTEQRRGEIKLLRDQLTALRADLHKLTNYNDHGAALPLILQSTHSFLLQQIAKAADEKEREELRVLSDEFSRSAAAAAREISDMQAAISSLELRIDDLFSDMKSHPYSLHAILVHEGKYDSHSSWAYVRIPSPSPSPPSDHGEKEEKMRWYRCNDAVVEAVEDEEKMFAECFGTSTHSLEPHRQRSTYSLIYLNPLLSSPLPAEFSFAFPPKLKFMVDQLNEKYRKEVDEIELNKRFADQSLINQFLRIYEHKQKEFLDLFHADPSTKVQIKTFKHFLESINRHNFVQYKIANRIHKKLVGFSLYDHDEFRSLLKTTDHRNLADFDHRDMMRINESRHLYSQAIDILSYVNESMSLWLNAKYLSSAMYLHTGIKADSDISSPLAARTPELIPWIETVLDSLCMEGRAFLEKNDKIEALERYTIAAIISSRLQNYPHIVQKVKAYWFDASPAQFKEVNGLYHDQITNFFNSQRSMTLGLKKQEIEVDKPRLLWEKYNANRLRVQKALSNPPA